MQQIWESRFGAVPPMGWKLRSAFQSRWFRIHSLPESKRYCESDEDRDVLVSRHYAVAEAVLGTNASCVVLAQQFCEHETKPEPFKLPGLEHLSFETWCTPADDPEVVCWVHAAPLTWDPAGFRRTLLAVANDEVRALLLSLDSDQVYAPYDGGADLILRADGSVPTMKARFRSWLSDRPDGM